jgi:hypothetical protein
MTGLRAKFKKWVKKELLVWLRVPKSLYSPSVMQATMVIGPMQVIHSQACGQVSSLNHPSHQPVECHVVVLGSLQKRA